MLIPDTEKTKKEIVIPLLSARDVELRVAQVSAGNENRGPSCRLLAYKDARVDMRILDEVFGWQNWERHHELIDGQLFCTVSVYDEYKDAWITKQDVGVESKAEAEKGRASDSFKRACFNFGIGRELYDAPVIWIRLEQGEIEKAFGDKVQLSRRLSFHVAEMKYEKALGEFSIFTVVDNKGNVRFKLDKPSNNFDRKPTGTDAGNDNKPGQDQAIKQNAAGSACNECGDVVNAAEADYCKKYFTRTLCRKCQNLARSGKILGKK